MDKIIVVTPAELQTLILECLRQVGAENQSVVENAGLYHQKPLTLKEAAQYLNLSQKTLYSYTSKKQIPFVKRGRLYFYLPELEAWLKKGGIKQAENTQTKQEGLLPFRSGRKRPL